MIFKWVFRGCALIILLASIVYAYWLWFDNPQLLSDVSSYVVDQGPIHAGDEITVVRSVCVSRPVVPNSAYRAIENTFVNVISDRAITIPRPGCSRDYHKSIVIPKGTIPGKHTYKYSFKVQVNPIRQDVVHLPDVEFNVEPNDEDYSYGRIGGDGPPGPPGPPGPKGEKGDTGQ